MKLILTRHIEEEVGRNGGVVNVFSERDSMCGKGKVVPLLN
jgi:hypothetical protein